MAKQNKNKKIKFNIIDALIILFFIALISVIIYVFVLGKDLKDLTNGNDTKEEAVVSIKPSALNHITLSNNDFEYSKDIRNSLL